MKMAAQPVEQEITGTLKFQTNLKLLTDLHLISAAFLKLALIASNLL